MIQETFDYVAYLDTKQAIDDDSLNPEVWAAMAAWASAGQTGDSPLRVLEIGAGTGTMIERLLDHGLITDCDYTAVEMEPGFREAAVQRQQAWSQRRHSSLVRQDADTWSLNGPNHRLNLNWVTGDILEAPGYFQPGSFDLLIGHAIIDLLPVPESLPGLLSLVTAGGTCYLSLNYAGHTEFRPPHPQDEHIIRAYHRDMDRRFPGLDWPASRTGLLLGNWFPSAGHHILAAGPSDWNLPPARQDDGSRAFIGNILDTIAKALSGLPGLTGWLQTRRRQLANGDLGLHAGNRDYFVRPASPLAGAAQPRDT